MARKGLGIVGKIGRIAASDHWLKTRRGKVLSLTKRD
jgi:hypothetical protein